MGSLNAFINALERAKEKNWDKMYMLLDIHGTVMKPNWNGLSTEFYPLVLDALKAIADHGMFKIIIWTCSKEEDRIAYKNLLESHGIPIFAVNENPDLDHVLDWGDYSKKPYCNVLLDDKAGFDPENEWFHILKFFTRLNQ